ncbi:hypothetical protein VP01_4113g1 [Puccinia sorghi]|uniref:Uncharacterized protein n=1 Tax=Puccinia sorghi TaxID=27349 RepID=A0A0L6US22_9BASI|nr:hypothetical protein VP01_4113g1 [Puccinia sorghi]
MEEDSAYLFVHQSIQREEIMMILTNEGTKVYLKNNNIWPGHWSWDSYVYQGEDEKEFLAKLVDRMIVFFGEFRAAREEQTMMGENYKTF